MESEAYFYSYFYAKCRKLFLTLKSESKFNFYFSLTIGIYIILLKNTNFVHIPIIVVTSDIEMAINKERLFIYQDWFWFHKVVGRTQKWYPIIAKYFFLH